MRPSSTDNGHASLTHFSNGNRSHGLTFLTSTSARALATNGIEADTVVIAVSSAAATTTDSYKGCIRPTSSLFKVTHHFGPRRRRRRQIPSETTVATRTFALI